MNAVPEWTFTPFMSFEGGPFCCCDFCDSIYASKLERPIGIPSLVNRVPERTISLRWVLSCDTGGVLALLWLSSSNTLQATMAASKHPAHNVCLRLMRILLPNKSKKSVGLSIVSDVFSVE